MAYRIMVLVEDLDYEPDDREQHDADAGWHGWNPEPGAETVRVIDDYEQALAIADQLSVMSVSAQW